MYRGGQLREILEISELGVKNHSMISSFTHSLSSSPLIDHCFIYATQLRFVGCHHLGVESPYPMAGCWISYNN